MKRFYTGNWKFNSLVSQIFIENAQIDTFTELFTDNMCNLNQDQENYKKLIKL